MQYHGQDSRRHYFRKDLLKFSSNDADFRKEGEHFSTAVFYPVFLLIDSAASAADTILRPSSNFLTERIHQLRPPPFVVDLRDDGERLVNSLV